ncbi:MAG: FecR domain-containing protein [Aquabacterium sp.]|nr:FecR domain-containing protein [Aquabacterium sp.]
MPSFLTPSWPTLLLAVASAGWSFSAQANPASCFSYTATEGDTLIGLAQQFLVRPADWPTLARLNHINQTRRIPIGTVLCIPVSLLKSTPQTGVVLEVAGQATKSPSAPKHQINAATAINKGDIVSEGMSLRTSTNGYVTVQLADGSILKVQSDTEVRLDSSQRYIAAGFFASIWSVVHGRVESLVTHLTGGEPRYQIKTPQAVLGVRGTEFRVNTDDKRTTTETLTGSVQVSGPKQAEVVSTGQGTVVVAGQVARPMALPDKPDVSGLPLLHERLVVRLDLPALGRASSYRAQVAQDGDFRLVRGEASSTQTTLRIAGLADGDYHLRVRAVDAQGLESVDSTQRFTLKARPEPPLPMSPAAKAKVRDTGLNLVWASHPDAISYRLQVAKDASFTALLADLKDVRDTQARIDLPPGAYVWRVATTRNGPNNGPDNGPWGDAQGVNLLSPPMQPSAPKVTDLQLIFELPGEAGQRFEFQIASDKVFAHVIKALTSDHPTIAISRPAEGGLLYVRFRAIDADGFIGPYSQPQLVSLPTCVRDGAQRCVGSGSDFLRSGS